MVKQLNACFNCLAQWHRIGACKSTYACRTCKKKNHHTLLHREAPAGSAIAALEDVPTAGAGAAMVDEVDGTWAPPTRKDQVLAEGAEAPDGCADPGGNGSCSIAKVPRGSVVFLCTIEIPVVNACGGTTTLRAMLDTGSQVDIITKAAADKLGWELAGQQLSIRGVGGGAPKNTYGTINCPILLPGGKRYELSCHVIDNLIGDLATIRLPPSFLKKFDGYTLADPQFHTASQVDVLIGIAHYFDFVLEERIQIDDMWLVHTVMGWAVTGKPLKGNSTPANPSVFTSTTVVVDTAAACSLVVPHDSDKHVSEVVNDNGLQEFSRFWETEQPPAHFAPVLKPAEKLCKEHYEKTTTHDADGRARVSLPFKDGHTPLGNSRAQAIRRFFSVERRLAVNPKLKVEYLAFMKEFIDMGHLVPVPEDEPEPHESQSYYLPHHGVLKESSTTTKLRVVFDGSAKTSSGESLNHQLLVGPRIQDEIFKILVRFRFHFVALAADVAKMYRQIGLHPADQDFHRLIWRGDPQAPLQVFRMTRVTYGITSSSYHAIRALQEAAEHTECERTRTVLRHDFYVDDFLGGAQSTEEALALRAELTKALSCMKMPIRKWSSNDADVLAHIPEEDREKHTVEVASQEWGVKTLGVVWNAGQDTFTFVVPSNLQNHPAVQPNAEITRRKLASAIATVFDPAGWLSPVTIEMKILFQRTWSETSSWDDPLRPETVAPFLIWVKKLLDTQYLEIPRRVLITPPAESLEYKLVLFTDASELAMAACVYVVVNTGSAPSSRLLAAKTKLAPKKTLTVPRLELMAMLLGARLYAAVKLALASTPYVCAEFSAYTDSTVALAWVRSDPSRWGIFVANRVVQIQQLVPAEQWRHVPGEENPADLSHSPSLRTSRHAHSLVVRPAVAPR